MKNRITRKLNSVQGVSVSAPGPTKTAAIVLATVLSIPTFLLLNLLEWAFF